MRHRHHQSGFTAVELLITLFVAAAFLIAAYQLFNVVIRDGGIARGDTRAGNVAYDYLRRYAGTTTNPCTSATPLSNYGISVSGLTDVAVTVAITCPYPTTTPTLSSIEATVTYGDPQQTVKYSTYSYGDSGGDSGDVLQGLIGWWPMNGNGNTSVGAFNATISGSVLPTTGQNGQPNNAYVGNGTAGNFQIPAGLLPGATNTITLAFWGRPTGAVATSVVAAAPDETANRFNLHFPWTDNLIYWDFGNASSGGRLTASFNSGWFNTWSAWAFTVEPGVGMKIYRNGAVIASNTTTSTFTPGTKAINFFYYVGNNNYWAGSLDDVRIYNRALSTDEIQTLYTNGAK